VSDLRGFSEFRESGLLWLVNREVFHPRGYALAFQVEDDGSVSGWSLLGDGSECWTFSPEADDEGFERVREFFA